MRVQFRFHQQFYGVNPSAFRSTVISGLPFDRDVDQSVSAALLELFRHKTWATLRLIEICQGLADEHLDATIPGTFGTIRGTLRHLVGAEEGYFSILTRKRLSDPLPDGVVKLEDLADGPIPLDELAERIRRLGPRWEVLAQDADLPNREVTSSDGWRFPGAVAMAQAIHHADDHRSHILSILGARGIELPDLAVWGYAEAMGQMKESQR
jgi:uncharacterized damage-inducible protein DinB